MKLLDNLKNIFKKNTSQLLLEENNIDIDRTQELITIETIEAILKDRKVFKKFLNFKDNLDFFDTKEEAYIDYVSAINAYAKYMLENGQKISKTELRRVNKISGRLPEVDISSKEIEKNQKLNELFNEIVSDKELFNQCIQTPDDSDYKGLKKKDILDYAIKKIVPFYKKTNSYNFELMKKINIFEEIKRLNENGYYRVSANRKMNPDFEDAIMKSAQFSEDKVVWAFNIYNELNKRVKYSTAFAVLDQDLSNPIAEELYYKTIENISLKDNKLTCKCWSELYAYFLEKIGVPAYINSDTKHRTVTAIIDEKVITADATNLMYNESDKTMLNDITRAKLEISPVGFSVNGYDSIDYREIHKKYKNLTINYPGEKNEYEHQDKVDAVLSLIGDKKEIVSDALNIKTGDSTEVILRKMKFLKEMLDESTLDNMENIAYMRAIKKSIFTQEESKHIISSYNLYTKIDENYDCDILPLMSVELAGEEGEKKYLYFMLEPEEGLHFVNKEKVITDLASGDLLKSDTILLPGFEDLDKQISILRNQDQLSSVKENSGRNTKNEGDTR